MYSQLKHRSAMETTNGHIKQLDTINSKILKTARFVASPSLSSIELFLYRSKTVPQLVKSSDNTGKQLIENI